MKFENIPKKILKLIFGKTKTHNLDFPIKEIADLKEFPVVSFIIPTRNEEKSIGKCIQAIVDDNYPNTEIIVIDDISKDKTVEIVKEYQERKS